MVFLQHISRHETVIFKGTLSFDVDGLSLVHKHHLWILLILTRMVGFFIGWDLPKGLCGQSQMPLIAFIHGAGMRFMYINGTHLWGGNINLQFQS